MARRAQRQSGARRTAPRNQRRVRDRDNEGIIPVLARAVREVETAVAARSGDAVGPHEVPGRGPARARGAGPGQGRRGEQRGPARRAAQAARRGRARSWPRPPPATPRCSRCSPRTPWSPRRPAALKRRHARGGRARAARRGDRTARARRARGRLRRDGASRRPAVGRLPPAGQPVPGPRLLRGRRPRSGTHRLAGWELLGPLFRSFEYAGGGAPACMPLPEPAAVRGTARPGADAAPGPGGRRRRVRATAPSCSPTSRGWARRPRRCSPRRRPTPTRCWWSCRTS